METSDFEPLSLTPSIRSRLERMAAWILPMFWASLLLIGTPLFLIGQQLFKRAWQHWQNDVRTGYFSANEIENWIVAIGAILVFVLLLAAEFLMFRFAREIRQQLKNERTPNWRPAFQHLRDCAWAAGAAMTVVLCFMAFILYKEF